MANPLDFGPYVEIEDGKRVVKELTYGNPTPEGVVLAKLDDAVNWMRKDLSICTAEARRNGAHLPVAALVDQFYSEVQKMGGGRWDTSALLARLER